MKQINRPTDFGNKAWYVVIALIGTIVGITTFLTGKNLPDFFITSTPTTAIPILTETQPAVTTNQLMPTLITPLSISTPTRAAQASTLVLNETAENGTEDWSNIVSVRMPTLNEIRQDMLSIWDANQLSLGDMLSPDTRSFTGTAQADREYLWPIYWCATDQNTLSGNVENITTVFTVNGEIVPDKHIFEYYYDTNTGWKCNYRATVIGGWQKNTQLILQVKRTFATQISDGQQSYPAGDYIYELVLSVN